MHAELRCAIDSRKISLLVIFFYDGLFDYPFWKICFCLIKTNFIQGKEGNRFCFFEILKILFGWIAFQEERIQLYLPFSTIRCKNGVGVSVFFAYLIFFKNDLIFVCFEE